LRAVVNADDEYGRRLLAQARIPMVAVHHGDAGDIVLRPGHTEFTWRDHRVTTPLTGSINVDNTLLAAEAALALGLEVAEVVGALAHLSPVPGRFQVVAAPPTEAVAGKGRPPFTVMVDYAHTPAGLEVVLGEARGLTGPGGRVLVVFGCGGNRDRTKRPKMGRAASTLSDLAVLTSDNPRDEDPLAIIEEVRAGVVAKPGPPSFMVEPDRGLAIRRALDEARPGDVVIIAGKGHETYQEVEGRRLPFDDVVEARQSLSVRYPTDPLSWVPSSRPDATPEGR
jgi:UDP-N-acetylmuramoyl-L-alanyl-D-glutamate--2,6-diaminopimelate ligase